ncbi:uncharacterized protein EAF02_009040 [Botrytis sinoallii]|uniref:uncharacterized protein n=1 Tax=Botrytis sinoallii TaxID=1463999 RepID=UPI0019014BA2|nr:uncharacterized protein EAF02_009040 [Botrytis sinoallii]KAF7871935.1 hypothetical protein EAF02_009040 [Botrytis sinoallii]
MTKASQARLREKAIQEGDGFGYPVSATEFDEAYEIYLGKVIRDFPGDSEDDRNLRAVRSVGIYLWRKMTLEQLLPDLFLEGLSTIAEETPASTSPEAARLESEAAESLRRATAAREEAEKASIAKTPAQHPQAPQATTMVAGMPLYGWLALKKEDPETAKMLMEAWQAEQTEKKARDLELERRMTDKEKNQSNWGPDGSYSQALTRPGADVKKNENEKKDKEKKDESRPNTNERRKPEAPLTLPRDAEGNPLLLCRRC